MSGSTAVNMDVNLKEAVRTLEAASDLTRDGAERAIKQLAVLAEGSMREEAPVGAGTDTHMRDTIRTDFSRNGLRAEVKPHKRTSEGWPLHHAIVGAKDGPPTYDDEKPPVWVGSGGRAQGPLAEWAEAKFGDRSAAWALRESIYPEGQETFPNLFINRSMRDWQGRTENVVGENVRSALEDA